MKKKHLQLFLLFLSLVSFIFFLLSRNGILRILLIKQINTLLDLHLVLDKWSIRILYGGTFLLLICFISALLFIAVCFYFEKLKNALKIFDKIFRYNTNLLAFFIFFLFFLIFSISNNNIGFKNLWFDESGQFWMAKGLNHFSPLNAQNGNIFEVLKYNAKYNLDPGGYTVLLHFWTYLGNSALYLRLLSYIFFILSIVLLSKLFYNIDNRNPVILFMPLLFSFSNLFNYYAFEIRPYSMELLATVLSLYVYYKMDVILQKKRYALLSGTLLGLLMTSRYSAILSVFVLCILSFIGLLKKYKKDHCCPVNLM